MANLNTIMRRNASVAEELVAVSLRLAAHKGARRRRWRYSSQSCVDSCYEVMEKFGRPAGLVRYTTENPLAQGWGKEQLRRRLLRPRVRLHGRPGAPDGGDDGPLALRVPLKVDLISDRGLMGREVGEGSIENVDRLQLMKLSEAPHRLRLGAKDCPES